jgi:PAS domain S-box-containing protein
MAPEPSDLTPRQTDLLQNENLCRLVVEHANDMITLLDLEARHVYVSPSFERFAGTSPIDAFGGVHPDDIETTRQAWVSVLAGQSPRITFRHRAADGSWRILEGWGTLVHYNGQPHVLGITRDITESRHAESALQKTVEGLRLAARASNVGLWDWDLRTDHVVFSREWKSQLGYDEHEIGDDYLEWERRLHPDDLATTRAALIAYQEGRLPDYAVEFRMRHKDGSWRWIYARGEVMRDANGMPTRMLGCHVDITERKRADEERLSYVWFLESMDRVNRAIASTNNLDLMVVEALDAVLNVFDCDRAFLTHPCDPQAKSWAASIERTRPEFPGASARGVDVAMLPEIAEVFRLIRQSSGPVRFGPGSRHPLPPVTAARFEIQSQLVMALAPKVGEPYAFGLHQCRYPREWTAGEVRLFQEIGNRLADALTGLVTVRQLEESEHRLRDAQRVAQVGHWQHDVEQDVVTGSDETYRIWGLQPGDRLNLEELSGHIHPDDRALVNASVAATIEGGPRHDMEFRILRPDGEERTVHSQGDLARDASGRPLRFFGTVQDITELRHLERTIVESHNLLSAVIEGTDDIVFVKDVEGRYLMINLAGARNFGMDPHEILGRNDRELWRRDIADWVMAQDRDVMSTGQPQTFEYTMPIDGSPRTFLVRKSVFLDRHGKVVGLIGISRDITEHNRLEEQLRQSQKMEAVGRLAGGVAHDFNNLLTVIHGCSELIVSEMPADDPGREMLAEIQKSAERAANLTRQLLAFSRKQVLRPQVVSVTTLLTDLLKLLQRLIGEDIEVAFVQGASLALARVDPGQFEQAIINLAVNARDAMPHGGRLSIETRNSTLDLRHLSEYQDVEPGSYVMVTVTDTGHGMDETTKSRIFEPFFTTKEPGRGTGLGLAMVYGFVKQSGGHIDVSSEVGRGTTFSLYLPQAQPADGASAPRPRVERVPRGSETVLLVEDEETVRELVKRVLQSSGYTVLDARDGEEALEVDAAHAGPIDILVTDLVMPRMGGRQLADELTRRRPKTRVLFMSGYSDEAMVRHGVSDGSVEFLQKPFTTLDFVRKVRDVLDART